MLSFTGSLRVFLAVEPCDIRKGFEGLRALGGERLDEQVRSGALFVFTNRRHTRLKVLYFDGKGLWLMTKRLAEGAGKRRSIYTARSRPAFSSPARVSTTCSGWTNSSSGREPPM